MKKICTTMRIFTCFVESPSTVNHPMWLTVNPHVFIYALKDLKHSYLVSISFQLAHGKYSVLVSPTFLSKYQGRHSLPLIGPHFSSINSARSKPAVALARHRHHSQEIKPPKYPLLLPE